MLVTAKCGMEAFDNASSQHYYPGSVVQNFDTESPLASLKTPTGRWVFQWEGRDEVPNPKVENQSANVAGRKPTRG